MEVDDGSVAADPFRTPSPERSDHEAVDDEVAADPGLLPPPPNPANEVSSRISGLQLTAKAQFTMLAMALVVLRDDRSDSDFSSNKVLDQAVGDWFTMFRAVQFISRTVVKRIGGDVISRAVFGGAVRELLAKDVVTIGEGADNLRLSTASFPAEAVFCHFWNNQDDPYMLMAASGMIWEFLT